MKIWAATGQNCEMFAWEVHQFTVDHMGPTAIGLTSFGTKLALKGQ